MKKKHWIVGSVFTLAMAVLAGCGSPADSSSASTDASKSAHVGHVHDGWWCAEHGMPEEVCALCNSRLAADFKAKGDWCKKHDRPDSQCFECHPEKKAEFVALYEAKYGTKPPVVR